MFPQEFALPAVGALIFDSDARLFLMKSSGKFGDDWIIPGGKISFGETMEEALRREVREETALVLAECRFLGVREYIRPDRHFLFFEFAARVRGTDGVILNEEATEHGWFTPEELDGLQIASSVRALIEERFAAAIVALTDED